MLKLIGKEMPLDMMVDIKRSIDKLPPNVVVKGDYRVDVIVNPDNSWAFRVVDFSGEIGKAVEVTALDIDGTKETRTFS